MVYTSLYTKITQAVKEKIKKIDKYFNRN